MSVRLIEDQRTRSARERAQRAVNVFREADSLLPLLLLSSVSHSSDIATFIKKVRELPYSDSEMAEVYKLVSIQTAKPVGLLQKMAG